MIEAYFIQNVMFICKVKIRIIACLFVGNDGLSFILPWWAVY